jgi:hypothetical protein
MAGLLERQNSPGWRKEMPKKYKYYKFTVRIEKILSTGEIKGIKKAIWTHMQDIAITDIQARKTSTPELRFEGDPVVRK